jgi:hypothetical protein
VLEEETLDELNRNLMSTSRARKCHLSLYNGRVAYIRRNLGKGNLSLHQPVLDCSFDPGLVMSLHVSYVR